MIFDSFCIWLQSCGSSAADFLLSGGSAGYNGAIPCDVFFSYAWWITFYNIFVWILAALTLIRGLDRFRPGIIALLAISIMQSMETANTYLYYDTLRTTSGTFEARAKVAAAGAIMKSIGQLLLVACIGVRNERSTLFEKQAGGKDGGAGKAPLGPPPSQSVLQNDPPTTDTETVHTATVSPL